MPTPLGEQVRCPGCKFMMASAFLLTHIRNHCKESYWLQARRYERQNHENRAMRETLNWGKKRDL